MIPKERIYSILVDPHTPESLFSVFWGSDFNIRRSTSTLPLPNGVFHKFTHIKMNTRKLSKSIDQGTYRPISGPFHTLLLSLINHNSLKRFPRLTRIDMVIVSKLECRLCG